VVDAGHRLPEERAALRAVAEHRGCRFVGLWLDAPKDVLIKRVRDRAHDASDATPAIVAEQVAEPLAPVEWIKIDASGSFKEVVAAARSYLT
jgi:predicted kinase